MKKFLNFIKKHIILFVIAICVIIVAIAILFIKDSRFINNIKESNINENNHNDIQLLDEEQYIDPLQKQREVIFQEMEKAMQQQGLILRDVEFEENSYNIINILVDKKTTGIKYNWGATRIPEESYNLLDSEHKKTITSVYGPAYINVDKDEFMIITLSESETTDETSFTETSLEKFINDNKWEGFKYSWKETLLLDKLNFDIRVNSNGSMEVTEIWQIDIKDTSTLFKTFKHDDITDVKVSEIKENGEKKEFLKIDEEMYHVTENCFYALKNSNGEFEIAWGINTQNEKKKYQISYTINNVVKVYNDCSELYWQFIGNNFSIPIKTVEGKIILVNEEKNINDINYWLHSNSKGIISKSNNSITFSGEDIGRQERLEVRLAMPRELFESTNIFNKDKLSQIKSQEKEIVVNNTNPTNNTSSGKVSINDIDKLAPNERLVANCAYSYLTSFSFMRDSLSRGKSQIISVEVLEKDNYGRYITEFVINEPFNSNYNIDRKHWIILWNIKEDGSFNYNAFKSYFTNQDSTLDMAKNNTGWNEPLN